MNIAFSIVAILSALSLFTPVFSGYVVGIVVLILAFLEKRSAQPIRNEMAKQYSQFLNVVSRSAVIVWVLFLIAGISSLYLNEGSTIKPTIRTLGNYGVKFVIVWFAYKVFFWRFAHQKKLFHFFTMTYAIAAVIHLVFCLLQRKFGFDWVHGFDAVLGPNRFAYGVYRISGFVGHPLTLGYCQALAFSASMFLAGHCNVKWEKFAWYTATICAAAVIMLSGSRGPQIALMVGIMILIPKRLFLEQWKILLPLAILGAFVCLKIGIFDRFFELLQNGMGGDERKIHLAVHWQIFSEFPVFGIGPSPGKEAISAYYLSRGASDNIMIAHNAFLQVAADFGVVGLVGVCIWFGSILALAKRSAVTKMGLYSVLGVAFVGAMFQNNFQDSEFLLALSVWVLILSSFEVGSSGFSRDTTSKNLIT